MMAILLIALTLALAAANGANDTAKGVATLAGAGVTQYRTAILWGGVATLGGSAVSLAFASRMAKLFSDGIVSAPPTLDFALAVALGASSWVALATLSRLPVSTTHALVGALIGAGMQLSVDAIHWSVLMSGVALPLLLSVFASYGLSVGLALARRPAAECTCIAIAHGPVAVTAQGTTISGPRIPVLTVVQGAEAECRVHPPTGSQMALTVSAAHWLTSAGTSFARGLNDTPKIVAIGAFGVSAARIDPRWLVPAVATAMLAGGLVAGARVGRILGEGVVRMSHVEGFRANLVSSVLVGVGANLGLPMSTTHVVTGAIAGAAGNDARRLNRRLLRDFILAWTATPALAAIVSALAFALLRTLGA